MIGLIFGFFSALIEAFQTTLWFIIKWSVIIVGTYILAKSLLEYARQKFPDILDYSTGYIVDSWIPELVDAIEQRDMPRILWLILPPIGLLSLGWIFFF